jgi:predicted dehydrogenase/threonine dehydrogenase-like Zn-dependent dehydrogenase
MKQVVQDLRSSATSVIDVPVPQVRPGMALVRTAVSLVSSGTERMLVSFAGKSLVDKARSRPDLVRQVIDKVRREGLLTAFEAVQGRLDQPMPLGYASAGTIVAAGEGLSDLRVGDRVACAGGGYAVHAEYALVPHRLLARLPENVDFESGAFATLGAIALHGVRLGELHVGENVAVIGLGLLGLLAGGIARAAGCRVFGVDLDPSRVDLARSLGLAAAGREMAEEAGSAFSAGRGFDVVLICADTASDDPVALAGALARDRGRVVAVGAVGMSLPRKVYYEKELSFLVSRSYGPGRYDPSYEEGGLDYPYGFVRWTEGRNLQAVVDMLADGRLDVRRLITHRFEIARADQAYTLLRDAPVSSYLGVLLTYPAATDSAGPRAQPDTRRQGAAVRLGVLGAGNFATQVLLPAMKRQADWDAVAIASGSGLSAASAARRFGFSRAAASEAEILHDPAVNAVAVLTRHHLHAAQVAEALAAGKDVFCEKPLALSLDEVRQVRQALVASGRLLQVGFNRRFAPLARAMRDFLARAGGPVSLAYRVNAGRLPASHWLRDPAIGGGRLIGEACHFVDLLAFLAGAPPTVVQAAGLRGTAADEDSFQLLLAFANGSSAALTYASEGDRAFPKERVEAFAGGGVAVLDDFRRLETWRGGRRGVRRSLLRQDKGHAAEWTVFVQAVRQGGPPPIPYDDLFAVTLATFAGVEALRSGQPVPVDLRSLD